MLRQTRVLVVDDSALMRAIIVDILNSDPELIVVGTAKNGKEAIDQVERLKPEVITLDVEMPVMDGITALEILVNKYPAKIIMLSSLTRSGAKATVKALELGAVDFVQKPSPNNFLELRKITSELVDKVKTVKNAKILKHKPQILPKIHKISNREKPDFSNYMHWLVGIGTSTGGPRALAEVIPNIPGSLPASFFVVQHMPPGFTKSLAERLDGLSQLQVKEGEDGELVRPGRVYIAPGDYHLQIKQDVQGKGLKIKLSKDGLVSGHRPSVDVLFESMAQIREYQLLAAIFTGMGADGSKGIALLKQIGAKTLAEDESSCVVYGMPRVAIEQGSIDNVVHISKMAERITQNIM